MAIHKHAKVIGLSTLSALVLSGFTLPSNSRILRHLLPLVLLCTGYYDPLFTACIVALVVAASPPENPSDAMGLVEPFQSPNDQFVVKKFSK